MFKFFEKIRSFKLYINGMRSKEDDLKVPTNPFSGRVIGRVFLVPQESLIFDELTPTEDTTAPLGV